MRVEISETRFHAQIGELVEVTMLIQFGGIAPATVSWASTSSKPGSAGAMQFANEVEAAAMMAAELDRAIKDKDDLKWATVIRSTDSTNIRVFKDPAQNLLIIVPDDWVIYAHGYEI